MKLVQMTPAIYQLTQQRMLDKLKEIENAALFSSLSTNLNVQDILTGVPSTAKVQFTHIAWEKMTALVRNNPKAEAAWHGVAHRVESGVYKVSDILCYPQLAGAATVESDDDSYPQWMCRLEDEVYNNLRFQAHSHVDFSATPSSVDTTNWDTFLKEVPDDGFYILMIINKRNEKYVQVIDKAANVIWENKDVKVIVGETDFDYDAWAVKELKDNLKERPIITYAQHNYSNYFSTPSNYVQSSMLNQNSVVAQAVNNNKNKKDKNKNKKEKNKNKKNGIHNMLKGK